MNRTLFIAAAGALACSTLYATASAAAPKYAMTQLRTVSASIGIYTAVSLPKTIDDEGVVVGAEAAYTLTQSGVFDQNYTKTHAVLWSAAGVPTLLTNNTTDIGSAAFRKSAGGILGRTYSRLNGTNSNAVTWSSSSAAASPLIAPQGFYANDISRAGTLLGSLGNSPAIVAGGTLTQLKYNTQPKYTYASNYGYATKMNANGMIVGVIQVGSAYFEQPFILSATGDPTVVFGRTPLSQYPAAANDLNDRNVIVGRMTDDNYNSQAAQFVDGQSQFLPKLSTAAANSRSEALGINNRGDVVGTSTSLTPNTSVSGLLWYNGQAIDLRTQTATLPVGFTPMAINNRGQILGTATIDDDNNAATPKIPVAYRLDPIHHAGDANYDNVVNFDDLVVLAQSYNKTGVGNVFWENGDFNQDWRVNFDDLIILAQRYNQSSSSFAADWALAQSLVPEPTSVMCVTSLAIAAIGRRRHGQ